MVQTRGRGEVLYKKRAETAPFSTLVFDAKSLTSSPQPWQQLQPPCTWSSFFLPRPPPSNSWHRSVSLRSSRAPASLGTVYTCSYLYTKFFHSLTFFHPFTLSRTTVALRPTIMVAGIIWKRDENRNWKIPLHYRANVAEETRITTPYPV